ncbi:MAG: hypothetical protein H0V84_12825 [Actinobacteria bacterium]|nr:hypothetical protein [Actinomycetota bacterium]
MTSEWDKETEATDDDAGFLGGGGPAAELEDGDDEELDHHGDNLATADEEDEP